ncbi:zf-HC2 domain-containing protein [Krasilnikovia sp. MM14-A1004]|uniref:zf-HC2 domain-containing protein n=1 Tax=Krasilnikovia sp. MM14-A1004 TaxID=3373541 RepID=UPI00399D2937
MTAELNGSGPHAVHLVGAYYMDALDEPQAEAVRRHLDCCVPCRTVADEMVETIAAMAVLFEPDGVPPAGEADADPDRDLPPEDTPPD